MMYAYDGRGSVHRNNNINNNNNKPHGYSYNQNRRRHNHGHGHGHRSQNQNQNHGHGHNNGPASKETPEPTRPPNAHADKLLTLLKTSGEYDRLRKLLYTTFQNSDMRKVLLSRVDGVVTECLENDRQLLSRPPDLTHQDLMKELDTYPFVERQVLCVPIWRDDEWISQIEQSIYNLIHDRAVHAPATSEPTQPPSLPPPSALLQRPPDAALLRNQTSAPWRVPGTAPLYIPEEMDQGLGEDDMAIDDD